MFVLGVEILFSLTVKKAVVKPLFQSVALANNGFWLKIGI